MLISWRILAPMPAQVRESLHGLMGKDVAEVLDIAFKEERDRACVSSGDCLGTLNIYMYIFL